MGHLSEDGDARSLYQARLRVFHLLLFCIGALQFAVSFRVTASMEAIRFDEPVVLTYVLHAGVLLLTGGSWLLLRRRVLGPEALAVLDVLIAGGVGMVSGAMLAIYPAYYRLDIGMLMVMSQILVGRAALVPSAPSRTVGVGLAVMLPVLIATTFVFLDGELPYWLRPAGSQIAQSAVWAAIIITLSALSSRVIYGLRRRVEQAQQLGQYTIERLIGRGGMGSVYLARHALLRRPTALKVLESDAGAGEAIARFEREVQTTSELTHPNTVAIYDYGRTPDARFYYAMEYLDGVDLETLVAADGPQPPARVVHILLQICGALDEAHRRGLVHRDVKPANVMLCQRGFQLDFVKVLDFGLVRAQEPGPALSREQTVRGTPQYMAPESITAPADVDARADIYAVGGVAYTLLAGRPPFDGKNPLEVMTRQLQDPPEPLSRRPGLAVPPALEALVLACLAKRPDQRPASMADLRAAIARLAVEPWTEAAAAAWWRDRSGDVAKRRGRDEGAPPATVGIDLDRREPGREAGREAAREAAREAG